MKERQRKRDRKRETEKERQRKRDRERETEKERQRKRERERETEKASSSINQYKFNLFTGPRNQTFKFSTED